MLQTLLDKQAITEVLYRLARGLDRCDETLLRGCFHPDATDDHGIFTGSAEAFFPWVMEMLHSMQSTMHSISNVLIEFEGTDTAHSECYFTAYHRLASGEDMLVAGRYLDRFTRREGAWRIAHRRAVYDWTMTQPASDAAWQAPPMRDLLTRGVRGLGDASYNG